MIPGYLTDAELYASLFALMSMGLTLTYMTTKVPNFAYGDFILLGCYSNYTMVKVFHSDPYLGTLVGFGVSGLVSVGMYLGILRPLAARGANIVSLMIATFGFDIAMSGVFGIFSGYLQNVDLLKDAKQPYALESSFGGKLVNPEIVTPIAVAAILVGIYILFTRTKFGVAMRAAIENPPLAKVLGINVDRVYTVSWLLAGGLAGLAGALWAISYQFGLSTGNDLIVQIFGSSVLGGLTSIFGSAAGGIIIGATSNLLTQWLNLGFGYGGTVVIAAIFVLVGVYLVRMKRPVARWVGALIAALGVWIVGDLVAGLPVDVLAPQLVNGFGGWVESFQQAIPLLVMAAVLLIIPEGIFSLDWKRILRRRKSP